MARYRIYYLKDSHRQQFQQAPPSPGPITLKMRDYQPGDEIEASSPYAAWKQIREEQGEQRPIEVGDALETETGALLVCKFVGFEEAQWWAPEAPPQPGVTLPGEAPAESR
ncbi:MAG: hypothetical protein HY238_00470 [Acidobacteria bacterium]|nr:hypothetical protein [Acidobacteriota bacterium]